MSYKDEIGRLGENLVADWLKKQGFIIVKRNYFSKYGEIDICAEKKEYIIFVEVKTREKDSPITPRGAVSRNKMKKIVLTAKQYLKKLRVDRPFRFDIAEVEYLVSVDGEFVTTLNYIKNAFGEEVLDNSKPF
ncbi:MAG: YraN family protein [Clostridia bacterium]|nr:YraN family protein [Clostridia bacterium]